jgi:hypothetical protein
VDLEDDTRAGQHQLSAVGPHDLALLADCPFHEQTGAHSIVGWIRLGVSLLQPRQRVMRDPTPFDRRRANLDGPHPACFSETGLDHGLVPLVERLRGHRVCR